MSSADFSGIFTLAILFQKAGQNLGSFKNGSLKLPWFCPAEDKLWTQPLTLGEAIEEEHHTGAVESYPEWGKLRRMTLGVQCKCSKFRRCKLNPAPWELPACLRACLTCLPRRHSHASVGACPWGSPVATAGSSQHPSCVSTATCCSSAAFPEVSGAVPELLWVAELAPVEGAQGCICLAGFTAPIPVQAYPSAAVTRSCFIAGHLTVFSTDLAPLYCCILQSFLTVLAPSFTSCRLLKPHAEGRIVYFFPWCLAMLDLLMACIFVTYPANE